MCLVGGGSTKDCPMASKDAEDFGERRDSSMGLSTVGGSRAAGGPTVGENIRPVATGAGLAGTPSSFNG